MGQRAPLTGNGTDCGQHFAFFYSKMTAVTMELNLIGPHMPPSSDPFSL